MRPLSSTAWTSRRLRSLGSTLRRVPDYLVLLTDRNWASRWQPHTQADPIEAGDEIEIDGVQWDVLNEWVDLDDVHLVFCVPRPKSDQHPPQGISASRP